MDDVLIFNKGHLFKHFAKEIYPSSLVLNQTNDSNQSSEYLDIDISIFNGKCISKFFDKTRLFKFKVIKLPNWKSLVPTHILINCAINEIRRIIEVTSKFGKAIDEISAFLLQQSNSNELVLDLLLKKLNNHQKLLIGKFGLNNAKRRHELSRQIRQRLNSRNP